MEKPSAHNARTLDERNVTFFWYLVHVSGALTSIGNAQEKIARRIVEDRAKRKGLGGEEAARYVAVKLNGMIKTLPKWNQKKSSPTDADVEVLLSLGNDDRLPRVWGEGLCNFFEKSLELVNHVYGEVNEPKVLTNLPKRIAPTRFIGREAEISKILKYISPEHATSLIWVDGIAGVGKTDLILQVADRCNRASEIDDSVPGIPKFKAIIFVSAKEKELNHGGLKLIPLDHQQHTLHQICIEIGNVLKRPNIKVASTDEQELELTKEALAAYPTLLIVDNLETMAVSDINRIMEFLYDLPRNVRVIVTCRDASIYSPIRLTGLPEEETLALISELGAHLDHDQQLLLCRKIGGIPAALIYAVGQLISLRPGTNPKTFDEVINSFTDGGDVSRFFFGKLAELLASDPALKLLMAISIFPKRPLREAAVNVAGIEGDPGATESGLRILHLMSLITERNNRYDMLPLTREYALAELSRDIHLEFRKEAYNRWVSWYLAFVDRYGGFTLGNSSDNYDRIEEEWANLLEVFGWCKTRDRYQELKKFWMSGVKGDNGVDEFADQYGYWADKLNWLKILVTHDEARGDFAFVAFAETSLAWTLNRLGGKHLIESEKMLDDALRLRNILEPFLICNVLKIFGDLRTLQGRYPEAQQLLDEAENIAKTLTTLPEREHARLLCSIYYYQGESYFGNENYTQAKNKYDVLLKLSSKVALIRRVMVSQIRLAEVAIEQGDITEVEPMLYSSLSVAEKNKDHRREAMARYALAKLWRKQGKTVEACIESKRAEDLFQNLGMQHEYDKIRTDILSWGCPI